MSEVIERIARCDRVVSWFGPNHPVIVGIANEPAPVDGGQFRDPWFAEDAPVVAEHLRRILRIGDYALTLFTHRWSGGDPSDNCNVVFREVGDRRLIELLPDLATSVDHGQDNNQVFRLRDGRRAWAATALLGDADRVWAGIAAFMLELEGGAPSSGSSKCQMISWTKSERLSVKKAGSPK